MGKIKLEDRISMNYALLFFILILLSNVTLVYSLKVQSEKLRKESAAKKIEEIESYFERVELIAKQTKSLSIDFNPTIGEGGQKIYHTKPFNPGEDNYLYVFEISNDVSDKVPINTVNSTDTDEATLSNERILEVLQKANIESENEKGKVLDFGKKNKYFTFKVSKQIRGFTFNVYTLKNITQEDKIYKRLEYLVLIFSMIGVLITIIIL